jgi:hypothetical protein
VSAAAWLACVLMVIIIGYQFALVYAMDTLRKVRDDRDDLHDRLRVAEECLEQQTDLIGDSLRMAKNATMARIVERAS